MRKTSTASHRNAAHCQACHLWQDQQAWVTCIRNERYANIPVNLCNAARAIRSVNVLTRWTPLQWWNFFNANPPSTRRLLWGRQPLRLLNVYFDNLVYLYSNSLKWNKARTSIEVNLVLYIFTRRNVHIKSSLKISRILFGSHSIHDHSLQRNVASLGFFMDVHDALQRSTVEGCVKVFFSRAIKLSSFESDYLWVLFKSLFPI